MGDGRGYFLPRTVFLDGVLPALLAEACLPPFVAFLAFVADCFGLGFVGLADAFGLGRSGAMLTEPFASSAALGMAWDTLGRLAVSVSAAATASCSKR